MLSVAVLDNSKTVHAGIESYKKERDHDFIMDLLAKDPHNFPDAALVADLDSERIVIPTSTPNSTGKQSISVYCIDAKPVGFVRIFNITHDLCMIGQIAVAEEFRRMGIGEKLLQYAIDTLRSGGAQMIILDTVADNKGAHRLYEKHGFTKMVDAGSQYFYSLQFAQTSVEEHHVPESISVEKTRDLIQQNIPDKTVGTWSTKQHLYWGMSLTVVMMAFLWWLYDGIPVQKL